MNNDYELLAQALDALPNRFPRTQSGIELRILQKVFTPEEAAIARALTRDMQPAGAIAERTGQSASETLALLQAMAGRGLIWSDWQPDAPCFRLAPFIVGFWESQLEVMDHELAHLVEEYLTGGGAAGIMSPQPALHRVIPAARAIKTEWVLPYDDVRQILLEANRFSVRACVCREQRRQLDQACHFPLVNCLSFSHSEGPDQPGDITQAQALALLDQAEQVGLVHTVSNVLQGFGYVCNCCGCCCGILRGITDWGVEKSVAYANYYAVIDPDECLGCGTCVTRCQVHAISEQDGVSVVDRERCIGCGLCVSGCPNDVAVLQRKPEAEIVHPPHDFGAWERDRLINMGRARL